MLEDLLSEISSAGWTVSWAFQFSPNHWRVSLCRSSSDGTEFLHCADAPTFALALETAYSNGEHLFEAKSAPTSSIDKKPEASLAQGLGFVKPITRRM